MQGCKEGQCRASQLQLRRSLPCSAALRQHLLHRQLNPPSHRPPAVEGLRSAKWQERLEAMGSVLGKAEEAGDGLDASFLLQALGFLPGWGDKNFQVWVWGGVGGPFSVWMGGCEVRPQAWRWLCGFAALARVCVCVTCGWVGRDGTRGRRHGAIDV